MSLNSLSRHRGLAITGATGVNRMIDSADVVTITSKLPTRNLNIVDNGAFQVDQRNSGAAVTPANTTVSYGPDRWYMYKDTAATFTIDQDTTAPAGFSYSLKVTNTGTDSSISATDRALIVHRMEGNKIRHLKCGSSDAATVTLSFYVRSSVTGTHGGAFRNHDANQRVYPFTYTINSADTWERKSITLTLDVTGTWNTDESLGLQLQWGLGVGTDFSATADAWSAGDKNSATGATTAMLSTSSATWYITGVQLEVGSQATEFEHKSYADYFKDCLRYFWRVTRNDTYGEFLPVCRAYSATNGTGATLFPVPMRSDPTMSISPSVSGNFGYSLTSISIGNSDVNHTQCEYFSAGSLTSNGAYVIQKVNNTDAISIDFIAELA